MIFCRFDKIVRLSSAFHRDMFLYKYNLKRERDKNIILKANMRLGNTKSCRCEKCNPYTGPEDKSNWSGYEVI